MDLTLLPPLALLALLDGTSAGTLGVPAWLALRPEVRSRGILLYLVAIAAFYWVVGLVLFAGAAAALEDVLQATEGEGRSWAQLALGAALFAGSFAVDPVGETAKRRQAERIEARRARGPSAFERLKARVVRDGFTGRTAAGLAVAAASLEFVTMLPYLAAIGLVVDADPGALLGGGVLLGYAALMIAPALGLLGVRMVAQRRAAGLLQRVQGWVERNSRAALGIVLGVGGFYLAAGAISGLGLTG